jgi:predicted alpha/beta-fold hydrolase
LPQLVVEHGEQPAVGPREGFGSHESTIPLPLPMGLAAHLRTIGPRLRHQLAPSPAPPSQPWQTVVDDPVAGAVRLTGRLSDVPGSDELVLLVHGLGGCTESHYMPGGAWSAVGEGLSCLRLNLRGADRLGDDFYHAGLAADLHAALASVELARYRRFYAVGYSLGGHVVLRLATEDHDPRLCGVAAVCAPVDLALAVEQIEKPWAWGYRQYLLGNLKRIYAAVAERRPVPLPVEAARRIRSIVEWDERIVAPRHGFASAADYYQRMSVAGRLDRLGVPALLLNSLDDPMVPARGVRPAVANPPERLTVRFLAGGGHVAFPHRLEVDRRVLGWLRGGDTIAGILHRQERGGR